MLRQRPKGLIAAWSVTLLLAAAGWPAIVSGCTLFGLAGQDVAGGGTLLVKNRDWRPDHWQELVAVVPSSGHRYVGLFARGGRASGLRAGVNDAGLTVVSATAGSIPSAQRQAVAGESGILRRLLAGCANVDEALAQKALFRQAKPCLYLLADRREVARVEIGLNGQVAVTRAAHGPLWQTNHYLEPSLAADNIKIGASSRARAARIETLLGGVPRPVTLDSLLVLSRDTKDGPDKGLWRTGGTPTATRTVATFAVAMPPAGPGTLFVRIADAGRPPRQVTLPLDAAAFTPGGPR